MEGETNEGLTDRSLLNMEDIWDFINTVDVGGLRACAGSPDPLQHGHCRRGLKGRLRRANIGSGLLAMNGDDIRTRARAWAAAGSDARMNGCELPVIIDSAAETRGSTASVPVTIVYAKELNDR